MFAGFQIKRESTRFQLDEDRDFDLGDITVSVGAQAKITLTDNTAFYYLAYNYALFEDKRNSLFASFGIYALDLNYRLNAEGEISVEGEPVLQDSYSAEAGVFAPLPVFAIDAWSHFTKRWALGTRVSIVGGSYQGVSALIVDTSVRANIREIFIRKRLKQFVPEHVYRELENSSGILKPTFSDASILFSDIRGFTRMTHRVPPQAIASFLNDDYFTPMGEIAYKFGGTVDKHIGDSIMVVFGTPVTSEDDPVRAVQAAVTMQKEAKKIDRRLAETNGFRLKTGIGISTGRVFSGILGSLRKKEFTSVGSTVNIAARLQAMAGPGEVIVSSSTFGKITPHIDAEPLPPVKVKGVDEPIQAYRVVH